MSKRIEYREIPGFIGYRVGSDGSLWSRRRKLAWRRLHPGRSNGHYVARLRRWTGKFVPVPVHHLVLGVFVGPRPEGTVACHNNGDGYDNRVENLRWDTRKANAADTVRHGVHRHQVSKLPGPAMLQLLLQSNSPRQIARLYGVTPLAIRRALDRDTSRRWNTDGERA